MVGKIFPYALVSPLGLLFVAFFAGCNAPEPGTERGSISSGGLERTFVFHVPTSAPAEGSRMLVVSLHGRAGRGVSQEDLTAFSALSDERGFVVIYPDGVEKSWADGRGTSPAEIQGVDDVAFLSALIDHCISEYGVDPKKVHVTGHSNGSALTHRLGCELSTKIAAIGPVAGTMAENVSTSCTPTRGVSVISFHGTEDTFMLYAGGELETGAGGKVLGAKNSRAFWANQSGCAVETTTTPLPDKADDGTTVEREDSTGCQEGNEIVLFTITGGGHTRPGSTSDLGAAFVGRSSDDIVASELMIDFFEKHPMP